MIHPRLKPFEDRHDARLLNKAEFEDLVLYKYSNHCVYEKAWDEYTRISRGIIFNKKTGEIIAKPFPKFFNLGEMPETRIEHTGFGKYEVFEKLDGSLGILYRYKGEYRIATPGSFSSEQAVVATQMLKKHDLTDLSESITLLFEIIYPSNKIICDYGKREELVLIGAYDMASFIYPGYSLIHNHYTEIPRILLEAIARTHKFSISKKYSLGFATLIENQKTISKNHEGYVVRFSNGLRVKIKGDEYLKFHKFIDGITPLNIWAEMENGQLKQSYKEQVPEEFRDKVEEIEGILVRNYKEVKDEIKKDVIFTWKNVHRLYMDSVVLKNFPSEMGSSRDQTDEEIYEGILKAIPITHESIKKLIGIFLSKNPDGLNHPSAIFPFLLGKEDAIEKYIMKYLRPYSNHIFRPTENILTI